MAVLAFTVRARAVVQSALLTCAVLAVGAEHVGRGVANVGLGEACNETVRGVGLTSQGFFKEVCSDALVVASDQGLVTKHASAVDREPVQDTNGLAVARPGEFEERHSFVHIISIPGSLCCGVGQVRKETAVNVCICNLCAAGTDSA